MLQSYSGIVYVFLALKRDEDRQFRLAELAARCTVARARHQDARTVIGIASERADDGETGLSFDLFMLDKPEWTAEDDKEATWLRESLGYFKSPLESSRQIDEYPASE